MKPETNQHNRKKRRRNAVQDAAASSMRGSELMAVAMAGDTGPGGLAPWPSLRTIFSTLWASAAM